MIMIPDDQLNTLFDRIELQADLNGKKNTCVNHALQCTARNTARGNIKAAKAVLEPFSMDNYLDSAESPLNGLNRSEGMLKSQSR